MAGNIRNVVAAAALWLALAAVPLFADEWRVAELAQYFTYGMLAMSLAFVWGHCGLLCLGQAIFFGLGAYTMSLTTLGMLPGVPQLVSSWLGLVLAMAVPALVAYVLGRFLFHGEGVRGAFFGIATLAVAFIAERLTINWDYAGGLNGLMNVPPVNLGLNGGGHELWEALPIYYLTLALVACLHFALGAYARSTRGVVLAAVRQNETRARCFGHDVAALKSRAFALGGAVAGLGGALFVAQFGFVSPSLIGFDLSAEALIWVAVGGREVLAAAFLGAIAVRTAESVLSEAFGAYWLLALGGAFMTCVVLLPRGLFGTPLNWLAQRGRDDFD